MKYGKSSFSLISALFPTEITYPKPELLSSAISSIAVQKAPDCEIKAIFPSPGLFLANERLILALLLIKPRQLGPIRRILAPLSLFVILSSSSLPSGPTSLKPAETIKTVFTFFIIHWSTISSTSW